MNAINFTNNISIPQILAIISGVGLILGAFRIMFFRFMNDWKADQQKMHHDNQIRQVHFELELQKLRNCIHSIPGHPENPGPNLDGPHCDPGPLGEQGEPGEPSYPHSPKVP